VVQTGYRPQLIANLRSVVVAPMRTVGLLLPHVRRALAGTFPILRNLCARAFDVMRRHGAPLLRLRPIAIPGSAGPKITAALAVAVLGFAMSFIYASGRFGRSLPASDEGAPVVQAPAAGAEQFPEDRPLRDAKVEFTRANVRYCTFQQIRLEALGPITEGA